MVREQDSNIGETVTGSRPPNYNLRLTIVYFRMNVSGEIPRGSMWSIDRYKPRLGHVVLSSRDDDRESQRKPHRCDRDKSGRYRETIGETLRCDSAVRDAVKLSTRQAR